jgi:pimeloyl-ACP methyl ester carboxylesterase
MADPAITNGSLREHRDIVLVDQRGTGGSNGLTCDFYGPPADPANYFEPFLPLSRVRECRDRLSAAADLTQYTTTNSVADLDDVRAAFGYERINLDGGSYGTRLALEYVRRHESRVRAVILEGVAPPDLHMPENFGITAQQALDALLDECVSVEPCATTFPSIRAETRAVFERLTEGPVRARVMSPGGRPVEVVLRKEHVAEAIRYMTYSSHTAARVPLVLHGVPLQGTIARYVRWALPLDHLRRGRAVRIGGCGHPRSRDVHERLSRARAARGMCRVASRCSAGLARAPGDRERSRPPYFRCAGSGHATGSRRRGREDPVPQSPPHGAIWRALSVGAVRARVSPGPQGQVSRIRQRRRAGHYLHRRYPEARVRHSTVIRPIPIGRTGQAPHALVSLLKAAIRRRRSGSRR